MRNIGKMETDKEVKELEETLKDSVIKTLSLKWRISLLIIIILVIVGSYFLGKVV